MEDRQLKAIDAHINSIAKIYDLEPFVIQKPKRIKARKIMTRFFQGISATLLAIAVGFAGVKCVEENIAQGKFDDAHFRAYTSCTNCDSGGWKSFENGTILLGHIRTCGNCSIIGKLNKKNTLIPIKQKGE